MEPAPVKNPLSETLPGVSATDMSQTPFALMGTPEEMAAQLLRQGE